MMGAIQKGLNEIFQKDPFPTGAEVLPYKNEQSAVRLKKLPCYWDADIFDHAFINDHQFPSVKLGSFRGHTEAQASIMQFCFFRYLRKRKK